MTTVILRFAGLLLLAAGLYGQQQPLPYSHKMHLALGLKCNSCHKNPEPGELMGYPAETFCMTCHQAIKSDSPHIQKLAAAAKEKKPIPWVRVYRLPAFVYFSHRVHTASRRSLRTCHGPVRERDVITKEVANDMRFCMACHKASKARNDCGDLPRRTLMPVFVPVPPWDQELRREPRTRRCFRMIAAKSRRAAFTCSAVGNAAATSGSKTTTELPAAYREA